MAEETKELIDRAIALDEHTRRVDRLTIVVASFVVVVLAIAVFGGLYFRSRQEQVLDNGKRLECVSRELARGIGGIGEALAAPPAPNSSRTSAVEKINAAAHRLRDVNKTCPD